MIPPSESETFDEPPTEGLLERGWSLRRTDVEAARSLALEARRKSRLVGSATLEAKASLLLATVSYDTGAPVEALNLARETIKLMSEVSDGTTEAAALLLVGTVLYDAEDFVGAIEAILASLLVCRDIGDVAEESRTLNALGVITESAGEQERALEYFEAALALAEPLQYWDVVVLASANLARLLWTMGHAQAAEDRARRAAAIAEDVKSSARATLLSDLSLYESAAGNRRQADKDMVAARELLTALGTDPRTDPRWSYVELAGSRAASARSDYVLSAELGERAVSYGQNGQRSHLASAHEATSDAYKELGDFRAAFKHIEQAKTLRAALQAEAGRLHMRALLVIHDTEEAQQEAAQLRTQLDALSSPTNDDSSDALQVGTYVAALTRIATTTEARFSPSGRHPRAVAEVSGEIAARLGQSPAWCDHLRSAARLHDLGKVALRDDEALRSPDIRPHGTSRFAEHTIIGEQLLSGFRNPELRMAATIARSHHECWDGTGFPDGLEAAEIPLEARIVAVADFYDSLISERASNPVDERAALALILAARGKRFDHKVVDAFHEVLLEHRPHLRA